MQMPEGQNNIILFKLFPLTFCLPFLLPFIAFLFTAVPGVKWREVYEEDPDRRGLHLAGHSGHV